MMITSAHAAVLAVHDKSKKFKVSFEVDTANEKGAWEETYQVPKRSSDVTFFAKQGCLLHRESSHRLLMLLGSARMYP
jgi:hypothetical protein